ncbi:hypothetical protein L3Q82_022030, partial [Scortum barcoo]
RLVKKGEKLESDKVELFVERLAVALQEKFRGHWYPETPSKGQAYRCIRVNQFHRQDPELLRACQESGVRYRDLGLPRELTLWVDPGEVCCRYGEQNPCFSVASFSNNDEEDKDVAKKVTSALERVTSDYHSGSSSDEESIRTSPLTISSSRCTYQVLHHAFYDICDQTSCTCLASGLEIVSTGPTSIEKASGQSVKLDCQFTLAPEDSGPLDIEWSLLSSDNQNEDKVVIMYSGDRAYEDYYPQMKGRVHFNSADPKNGDASIILTGLKSSDSGTYQCKVKKAPGIRSRKMLLIVMVKPSKPRCYAEGPTQEGKDIVLRCISSEGTNPLQYSWERTSDSKLLPASTVLDPVGGTINVRNASASASGTYRCTASNRVGSEECILYLKVTPPPNTAGIIAGAIIAVLLILIIIAIILFCCCRARHKKKYEKEICNEIREDVPPPKSRVSTARSFTVGSQRSSLGSMSPSNLHEYALKPQYDKIPSSEEFERPPSHAPRPPAPAQRRQDGRPQPQPHGGHTRHDPCPEQGRLNRLARPLLEKGPCNEGWGTEEGGPLL